MKFQGITLYYTLFLQRNPFSRRICFLTNFCCPWKKLIKVKVTNFRRDSMYYIFYFESCHWNQNFISFNSHLATLPPCKNYAFKIFASEPRNALCFKLFLSIAAIHILFLFHPVKYPSDVKHWSSRLEAYLVHQNILFIVFIFLFLEVWLECYKITSKLVGHCAKDCSRDK